MPIEPHVTLDGLRVRLRHPPPADGTAFRMTVRVPFADTEVGEYWVTKHGHEYHLAEDIVIGDDLPRVRGNVVSDGDARWPGAQVPIQFGAIDDSCRALCLEVLNELCRRLPVTFRNRRAEERDYVEIVQSTTIPGDGRSRLGRAGGRQELTLKGTPSRRTVVHELLHAIGMHHEHCRGDRDDFVEILEGNIAPGNEIDFQKFGTSRGGYDFDSVMHYHSTAFGKAVPGGQAETIRQRGPGGSAPLPASVGTGQWPSPGDLAALARLYAGLGSVFGFVDGAYERALVAPLTGRLMGELVWDAAVGAPRNPFAAAGVVDFAAVSVRAPTRETREWASGSEARTAVSGWRDGPIAQWGSAALTGGQWRAPFQIDGLPVGAPVELTVSLVESAWAGFPDPPPLVVGRSDYRLAVDAVMPVRVDIDAATGAAALGLSVRGAWVSEGISSRGDVLVAVRTALEKELDRPNWVQQGIPDLARRRIRPPGEQRHGPRGPDLQR